jgi:hypothetical protein
MFFVETLFNDYVQLRNKGHDANDALDSLRERISLLSGEERTALVKQVRRWEAKREADASANQIPAPAARGSKTEPIPDVGASLPRIKPIRGTPATTTQPIICPKCAKPNAPHEVFCYSCGTLLQTSGFETERLEITGDQTSAHFGAASMLVMVVRGSNKTIRHQPQHLPHETIVGRGDSVNVRPDIDLAELAAGQLGVSRMHLAIKYDSKHSTLIATDLNSVNGTYINGQRLFPHEVRVLNHGDELRLGKMVLQLYFQHPR